PSSQVFRPGVPSRKRPLRTHRPNRPARGGRKIMIIDFRLRPATRGFLNMHIFRNQERIASWSGKLGMVPPPSAKQGDMELMLKEMEEGGVTLGVVPGRQANAFMGNVPNEDIAAIVADYPEKFIGVAGIDPTNRAKALEEIERFVVNRPLKAVGMEPGVLASPMYADDRRIYPIYEYCAEHGIRCCSWAAGATARISATATRSSSTGCAATSRNDRDQHARRLPVGYGNPVRGLQAPQPVPLP
ncbi:MAG: amidohydrolase family protein, partial [Bilophila wadsworthia]